MITHSFIHSLLKPSTHDKNASHIFLTVVSLCLNVSYLLYCCSTVLSLSTSIEEAPPSAISEFFRVDRFSSNKLEHKEKNKISNQSTEVGTILQRIEYLYCILCLGRQKPRTKYMQLDYTLSFAKIFKYSSALISPHVIHNHLLPLKFKHSKLFQQSIKENGII